MFINYALKEDNMADQLDGHYMTYDHEDMEDKKDVYKPIKKKETGKQYKKTLIRMQELLEKVKHHEK